MKLHPSTGLHGTISVRAMIYQLSEELSTVRILGSYRISDSTETR